MMEQFQEELLKIKEILKTAKHGMSVTEIARTLNKNKHSVGRYLDILLVSGHVEMRNYGKAKVFSLSSRVPLDSMLGYAHDLILVLDRDNRIVRINDQFLNFVGMTRDDVFGKNISFLSPRKPAHQAIFTSILTSLDPIIRDREITVKNDPDRVFRQKIILIVFEDGNKGTAVMLEDITEKKSSENALRASEEQFRRMAENIQDGLIISENGKAVYANQRVEEIFGYNREELSTLSPVDLAAPEERDRIRLFIDDFMNSRNTPSDFTLWIVRKDGTRRYIANRITSVEHGNNLTRYNVITDMTEWKHAQDALENQLGFLQHMINTFPNPLFYIDTRGRYLGCNSAFVRIIGKTFEEIGGKTDIEILEPEQAGFFSRHNSELFQHPGVISYTGLYPHSERSVLRMTIQKSSLITREGTIAGLVCIILTDETIP